MLAADQLRRLAAHRYNVEGSSVLDPVMQPFWRWLVERVPFWWAPNALTLAGLAANGLSTIILMIYSPDGLRTVGVDLADIYFLYTVLGPF